MKKKILLIIGMILILTALTFVGCSEQGDGDTSSPLPQPPTPTNVSVSAKQESVSIRQKDFKDFNFSSLFIVTVDGEQILIQPSYLDLSGLPQAEGETGTVVCTYQNASASCSVTIVPIERTVELSAQEITVTQLQIDDGYDFLALFSIYQDGEKAEITADMINDKVTREVGDHTFSVTFGNDTKVLTVHVTEAHRLEVVKTYRLLEIVEADLETLDVTDLFSLYVDSKTVAVTADMIDATALDAAVAGQTYEVKFSYTYPSETVDASINEVAYVKIIEPKTISITAKNVVTYPNSKPIDLTSLFTIVDGDEPIAVTIDMISGTIDYTKAGVSEITLSYKGQTRVAQIEVKKGVVINKVGGDTVVVKKGTDKATYDFANDIQVIVNGLTFSFVTYGDGTKFHIDTTDVDFDTLGTYTANVAIPYGKNRDNVTDTITYVVKENTYEASVIDDNIVLAKGTTEYNVLKNVDVKVNGIKRSLTTDRSIAETDNLAVLAQIISGIDYDSVAVQNIKIAVYFEGADSTPAIYEYSLRIKSNVVITTTGKIAFGGDTVYTKDLFAITDDGKAVAVTTDMLEGKVDTFTAGVYPIKIHYLGLTAVANVVVLSEDVIGIYKTNMTTIPSAVSSSTSTDITEDDWYTGAGDSPDSDNGDEEAKPVYPLANMTILRDGTIRINGMQATVKDAIDQNTIVVEMSRTEFTIYLNDGVAVINPDNRLRMAFHDTKRPMVYFKADDWELKSRIVVNSGSNYVLSTTNSGYSFDVFEAESKADGSTMWYALYVRLISSASSDSVYDVSWGQASLPQNFTPKAGAISTLTYNGNTYDFEMATSVTSKVIAKVTQLKYASKTFDGTVDGKSAKLYVGSNESFSLQVGGKPVFSASPYDISSMKNGGIDYENDTVFLYQYTSGKFYSYKFRLDVQNNAFECDTRDSLLGFYEYDGQSIFLDGYGSGIARFRKKTDGTVVSYCESKLTYELIANELVVTFVDKPYDFAWGDGATFYLATFGNVLTVKQMTGFDNVDFVNSHITDGAVVTIGQTRFPRGSSWEKDFFSGLKIVTVDGKVMTTAEKENCTDVSQVGYGNAGFYNVYVTLNYAGQSVTADYAVQITHAISGFSSTAWVADYGSGAINSAIGLKVESTGMVTATVSGDVYEGYANLSNDVLYATLKGADGKIELNGKWVDNADGLLLVRASGAVSFNEYFTKGTKSAVSGAGATIRKFSYDGTDVYFFSSSAYSTMQRIDSYTVIEGDDMQNGSIVSFAINGKAYVVKIVTWGNMTSGLMVSDSYRGTYAKTAADDLVIDGFGNLKIGTADGTYTINQNGSLLVVSGGNTFVLDVDLKNKTYANSQIALDESLVAGKTFTASYNFACYEDGDDTYYSGLYKAITAFRFLSDGKVRVTSSSSEHDDGEDACSADVYDPPFASEAGNMGTFSVSGKTVTVTVGTYEFTFEIDDVSVVSALKCTKTTVSSTDHGYFSTGTQFSA